MAGSTGPRGPSFLPNALDWVAVQGRRGSPAGIVCRRLTSSKPSDQSGAAEVPASDSFLESCYRSCLGIACRQRFRDIASPAIATGIYGCLPGCARDIGLANRFAPQPDRHALFEALILDLFSGPRGLEHVPNALLLIAADPNSVCRRSPFRVIAVALLAAFIEVNDRRRLTPGSTLPMSAIRRFLDPMHRTLRAEQYH